MGIDKVAGDILRVVVWRVCCVSACVVCVCARFFVYVCGREHLQGCTLVRERVFVPVSKCDLVTGVRTGGVRAFMGRGFLTRKGVEGGSCFGRRLRAGMCGNK